MSTLFKRNKEKTDQKILLSYKGRLSFDLIHSFIENVDKTLEKSSIDPRSKRKIFNVLVEVFQNLTHHIDSSDDLKLKEEYKVASLKVWLEGDFCYVATGNHIHKENVEKLDSWLTKIDELETEGVKQLYREVLNNGTYSERGGGGLGFIDIRKKAGHKFTFEFEEVNKEFSYFNFETKVNIDYI